MLRLLHAIQSFISQDVYTHNTLYTNGVCVSSRTQKAASMKRVKPPPEARQSVVGVYRNPMFSAGSREQLNAP